MPRVEWFDFTDIPRQCERYRDYAVLSGGTRNDLDIRGYSTFQMPTYLRPMEQLFRDLYLAPDLAHALFQRFADFFLAFYERLFQAARGGIDIFVVLDDYGGQQGPLIRKEAWRDFVRPYLAPGIALAKSHGLAVMLHSCGSVRALIPEFLELGVDILDPIQVQAAGMDPEALAEEFGDRLTFHGSIDIQRTLPFGTPADVRAEVAQRQATLGRRHGFILGPCHNIQPDTPLANILTLYGLG
jgi:uroporphyrinogen decarboxylase